MTAKRALIYMVLEFASMIPLLWLIYTRDAPMELLLLYTAAVLLLGRHSYIYNLLSAEARMGNRTDTN